MDYLLKWYDTDQIIYSKIIFNYWHLLELDFHLQPEVHVNSYFLSI